jgi:hypothetical protein
VIAPASSKSSKSTGANPFQLASVGAEPEEENMCSTSAVVGCKCESSASVPEVSICYSSGKND